MTNVLPHFFCAIAVIPGARSAEEAGPPRDTGDHALGASGGLPSPLLAHRRPALASSLLLRPLTAGRAGDTLHQARVLDTAHGLPAAEQLPADGSAVHERGRLFVPLFLVLLLFQMALLLLCYAMFFFMVRSLGENMRLQSENNLLQLEASQYESLKNSIEETRRIRHDLRQHMAAIQGCVDRGDMSGLLDYIAKYRESFPGYLDEGLSFRENYAVNSVLRFYAGGPECRGGI